MKSVSTLALGLALAFGTAAVVSAPAVAAKKEKPAEAKYTPAVQNAASAAQKALAAGDIATATAKITEAKTAVVTDDDKAAVGSILYSLSQKNNDQAMRMEGVDMLLASGKAGADTPTLWAMKGDAALRARNAAGAEAAFLKAQETGSTEPNLVPLIVQAKSQQGKTLEALQTLNSEVAKKVAAGQPVPPDWFGRGINDGYAAKSTVPDYAAIKDATTALTEKWVSSYPTKSNWRDTLIIYRDMNRIAPDVELDNYRLLRTIGGLKGERDYMDYVQAVYLRFPGEAKAVLDDAVKSGQMNLASNKNAAEINTLVGGKIAADKASLASSAKSAGAAANGKAAMGTADAFLGYGEWQKAIDLYKVALTKGGVDADAANLHLAQAQAAAGQTAEAKATLANVKGTRAQIAKFWLIYLDHPVTG
jgi:tetratricopeptide (TPR) repeat protein